ncbi:MAG: LacI family DNA-binding transcriptional regulator [Candidatus Omnitrophota bacterium]|nr:LacI family DNA-binding transcriptional regulator [Candidatus Omnitrophota bacterium]
MPKFVSIKDVAKLAGVSCATVSRVINKADTVKAEKRIKVEEVIKKLKFKPNLMARQLAKGKSNIIALVIPRYEGIFYSYYGLEIIRGIGTICDSIKMDILLHITEPKNILNLSSVGGIIFAEVFKERHQLEEALNLEIPAVVMNNLIQDLEVTCVAIDNKQGAIDAVNYLFDLGHKDIAYISGGFVTQAAKDRTQGFFSAFKAKKIPVKEEFVLHGDYSRRSARGAAEKILSLKHKPTAIFVASDDMAQEVISVIIENGLRVPGNISVIGFDDNPVSIYGSVPLTTIRQPLMEMAQIAVRELDLLMKGEAKVSKFSLPTKLIIRDSCRALSA